MLLYSIIIIITVVVRWLSLKVDRVRIREGGSEIDDIYWRRQGKKGELTQKELQYYY